MPIIGFGQFLCSQLAVSDIVINSANMTIDISIYDGNIGGQPYPYIAYTIDNLGDTIQTGSLNSFGNLGLDTSLYLYSLNSLPNYPLTVCYAYGMNSDTCILTYNSITAIQEHTTNKDLLKVTDILGRETNGTKNEPLFYIYDDGTVEKRIILE
tara:strand:- start:95 stop:556 length:462 start_codon:yes stop_codon:yes gene_type:complete